MDLHAGAVEALSALCDQTFDNVKETTPALEDLLKAAAKYQQMMEAANEAAGDFLAQFGKVAVTACKSRGGTAALGSSMQKVLGQHHAMLSGKVQQVQAMNEQFLITLQKRIKTDSKTFTKMEDDYKTFTKKFRGDLKKAGEGTVKAQKVVKKKGAAEQPQLDTAMRNVQTKSKSFEEFNARFLRTLMIEERRRYCYLVDNYLSVFDLDFRPEDHALLKHTLDLASSPEDLPATNEALILQNSSTPQATPTPQPRERPSGVPVGGVAVDLLRATRLGLQNSSNGGGGR